MNRAARQVVERLESRQLLAVVAAGQTGFFYTGTNIVRVDVSGTGSITLVGFTRPKDATTGGGTGLSELPMTIFDTANGSRRDPASTTGGLLPEYNGGFNDGSARTTGGPTTTPPIYEIYSIYSGDSTANTSVSISTSSLQTGTGLTINRLFGTVTPYSGGAGTLRTNMLDPDDDNTKTLALSGGGVFIGGRQGGTEATLSPVYSEAKDVSIQTSAGVKLKNNQTLKPGLYVTGSLKNFFLGGTIIGAVNVTGSVDTFYASNVLTGDVLNGTSTTEIGTDNFAVGGDLRNLLTSDGIGTVSGAPRNFVPNTDIQVGGRIQQIKSGGDFRASVEAVGADNTANSIGTTMAELETREPTNIKAPGIGQDFLEFKLANQNYAKNDTFQTPTILGTAYSPTRNRSQQVSVTGTIDNLGNVGDAVDFYGLALLAGQSAVIQLVTAIGSSPAAVQVYDPDGNVVASDFSNQNPTAFLNRAFTVTADQPGLWRLAVIPQQSNLSTERQYTLTVDKAGELAIGGVQSGGELWIANETTGIQSRTGDVGAVLAAGELFSSSGLSVTDGQPDITNTIDAQRGNVRSVEGSQFGLTADGKFYDYFNSTTGDVYNTSFPTIIAAKSVGLVRANAATGRLYFNQYSRGTDDRPSANLRVGGDYQVIETRGDFSAVLSADGGIGVIRVGSIGTAGLEQDQGYFEVNADGTGNDGFIGLIDVAGDMGTFNAGGPAISGGAGSNVRYIRVGGAAYRDIFFGAGNTITQTSTSTSLPAISDDSGALVTITPIASQTYTAPADQPVVDPTQSGSVFGSGTVVSPVFGSTTVIPNPFGGGGAGVTLPTTDTNGDGVVDSNDVVTDTVSGDGTVAGTVVAGTVTVETYPVRSGGSVILSVTSDQGVQINTTGGGGATAAGDIGELLTASDGATIITHSDSTSNTPSTETPADLASGKTNEVLLTGSVPTNVFSIAGATGTANYTRVVNTTSGEIVNLVANSVAYLEAQSLGVGRTAGGVTVEGLNALGITGDIAAVGSIKNAIRLVNGIEIRSRGAIGNVISTGTIQSLVANSDQINVKGQTEGIVGIVYASSELRFVDIGEGLATSGTGIQQRAGLYSSDTIGVITNVNGGGDLRGDVVARQNVESITLTGGGSIVDADIIQAGNVTGATALLAGDERASYNIALVSGVDTTSGIGSITISGGNGGIMNAQVVGLNIGRTTVGAGGFGVLTSRFFSSGGGRMEGITAAGLGIRSTVYQGGGTMGDIIATGGGALADLNNYDGSVRASKDSYFDSNTGIAPNASNDLYLFFQTSTADSAIIGVTNEGIIADTNIAASQSIGNIRAFDFRTFNNPTGIKARSEAFPNQINFGQSIGSITAKRDINGLRVVGAAIGSIVSRDMKNFQVQTTGAVGTINAKRNVLGSVNFNLINDGALTSLAVGGNFAATGYVAQTIDRIVIDGDFSSQGISGGFSGLSIRSVRIGGDVNEGSLLRSRKRLSGITINGDLEATATIRANPFGKVTIKGATDGRVVTG